MGWSIVEQRVAVDDFIADVLLRRLWIQFWVSGPSMGFLTKLGVNAVLVDPDVFERTTFVVEGLDCLLLFALGRTDAASSATGTSVCAVIRPS